MQNDPTGHLRQQLVRPDSAGRATVFAQIVDAVKALSPGSPQPRHIEAYGTWGSLSRLLAAILAEPQARPILFVTGHIPTADKAQDDLETFLSPDARRNLTLLPAAETHEAHIDSTSDVACERISLCGKLTGLDGYEKPDGPLIIVSPIQALMQPLPGAEFFRRNCLGLSAGTAPAGGTESIAQWLVDHQFSRVDQVECVGEFAQRGGIIDIFISGEPRPIRLEFFGDELESIRTFDLDTQRSAGKLREVLLVGMWQSDRLEESCCLLDYLPKDALLIVEQSQELIEAGKIFLERIGEKVATYPVERILADMQRFDTVYINRFTSGLCRDSFNLRSQSLQRFCGRGCESLLELVDLSAAGSNVFFCCESAAEQKRIVEMICSPQNATAERKIPDSFHTPIGFVDGGFELPEQNLLIIGHHEAFGQHPQRRRIGKLKSVQAIESFTDLEINDLVVHLDHGIGRFLGIKTITKNGRKGEFLSIEYADKAALNVPAGKIDLVHKYIGSGSRVKLSKLGGKSWQKQKQKVAEAVGNMAAELVALQAHRISSPGIAYPADSEWQKQFEQSFAYQDTEDQQTANDQIKKDMQQSQPMDRLLCGDVGYGKTELAIRASFKAVEHGKQVAVLVPTTVLAEQHYRTFRERLADFPFTVEVLSRFKTAVAARDIIKRTALGRVDVLIGTHRILSSDVAFKDIGLIAIDEEQRFGVEHKERLKKMRKTVDILTMTATPIPRTLHMALLGIRQISSLATAPLDRRSIVTEVCPYDKQKIRRAILEEMARDGQVYFLHNRVNDILSRADALSKLVPEARITVAHGRMAKRQLESCMLQFVHGQADVLVCTTIIESGLDIPNANTIIINDADRFGLAELHQLRGRVGRYKNRAYAYMLLPARRAINPVAVKRLKAIEEYSQLGSGFRIALRDLEIRGAGNILGPKQSGHIDVVGYDLYCKLLGDAVRRQRGEAVAQRPSVNLELAINTDIPRSYIQSDRQRMDVYRRLATCLGREDLDRLGRDLADLFGPLPDKVSDLIGLAELRLLAGRCSIKSIVSNKPDLIFTSDDIQTLKGILTKSRGTISSPDDRTVHLRLPASYFDSPVTVMALLRKLLISAESA